MTVVFSSEADMADQTDLPAWIAGIVAAGTAVGGFCAGIFKPSKPADDLKAVLNDHAGRIQVLEENAQRDRREVKETLTDIYGRVNAAATDAAVCRAILDDRKKQV